MTTVAVPQHMAALARANEVRLGAAALRRELRSGELAFADAVYDPRAGSMTVERLLMAQPRWGSFRAGRALGPMHISPVRRVSDLTDRQRAALLEHTTHPPQETRA